IFRFLVGGSGRGSAYVSRKHEGWSESMERGVYQQGWDLIAGTMITAPTRGGQRQPPLRQSVRTLVRVNNVSYRYLESGLDALQREGKVKVVLEKTGSVGVGVAEVLRFPRHVIVRLNKRALLSHRGTLGFYPDEIRLKEIALAALPNVAR